MEAARELGYMGMCPLHQGGHWDSCIPAAREPDFRASPSTAPGRGVGVGRSFEGRPDKEGRKGRSVAPGRGGRGRKSQAGTGVGMRSGGFKRQSASRWSSRRSEKAQVDSKASQTRGPAALGSRGWGGSRSEDLGNKVDDQEWISRRNGGSLQDVAGVRAGSVPIPNWAAVGSLQVTHAVVLKSYYFQRVLGAGPLVVGIIFIRYCPCHHPWKSPKHNAQLARCTKYTVLYPPVACR